MTIPELIAKCKSSETYTVALILLVGFSSFGLGRLSRLEGTREPVRAEQVSARMLPASAIASAPLYPSKVEQRGNAVPMAAGGQVVASKGGSKYHFPWCSGAQQISEANKISFNSVEEARKAGYTPASNCKGLR